MEPKAKRAKHNEEGYTDTLPPEAKQRYFEKIVDIDGVDPYDIPKRSWSADPEDLPEVDYICIVNYFVFAKSANTKDEFRAYKSLKSYKAFQAGWVRDVVSYRPDGCQNTVVSAKVLRSQVLNEKPVSPWFIASADGTIVSAHCTCLEGLGETCTHVGALTFAVDAFNSAREKTTCTDEKAYWKVPEGAEGVSPKPAYAIDFGFARSGATVPAAMQERVVVPEPTEAELTELFQQLNSCKVKARILKMLPQYCDQYKTEDETTNH
ncbi:hypothetical protein BaRGS_00028756 [Batillaria attramentaria]|uniref:SWIM-type domain-containing protein n=1 Tax=Batillaria attramentaria TaxID=370345 RepID=A0ABD0JYP3_9CAEN